jgi:telomerase reverse transcriptase
VLPAHSTAAGAKASLLGAMARKRKRGERETCEDPASKKCKWPLEKPGKPEHENIVKDYLLSQYYRKVLTLREFLLWRLPSSSKVRRKRIASVGCHGQPSKHAAEGDSGDATLGLHLDGTLVGVLKQDEVEKVRSTKDLLSYSQLGVASKVMDKSGVCEKWFRQSEVCGYLYIGF